MKFNVLPHTNLSISQLGLGTMTFGVQNSLKDSFAQLDYAIERGINFIDTAEMYPVPPSKSTYGITETYIGQWLEKTKKRDNIILATKIVGPVRQTDDPIRNNQRLDLKNIRQALNDSLKRLKTDHVDLYQLHWPQRTTNIFGKLNYKFTEEMSEISLLETLDALCEQVKAGKIRYIGVSNETPWGVMKYLNLAEKHNLPKVVSIQNPYSLLNRSFEFALSEICQYENIRLLAYSCLGFGVLTGKYINNTPPNARNTLFKRFVRYSQPQSQLATQAYVNLAKSFNINPVHMALAFVNQQPFNACTLLGATSVKQLEENIDSLNVTLSQELLEELDTIHARFTYPAP